jgi:hypothetical protein
MQLPENKHQQPFPINYFSLLSAYPPPTARLHPATSSPDGHLSLMSQRRYRGTANCVILLAVLVE